VAVPGREYGGAGDGPADVDGRESAIGCMLALRDIGGPEPIEEAGRGGPIWPRLDGPLAGVIGRGVVDFGGGGVPDGVVEVPDLSALLTHFLSSGSK
jgi:hypothetical protein